MYYINDYVQDEVFELANTNEFKITMGHCGWFFGTSDIGCTLREWEFINADDGLWRGPDGKLWRLDKCKNSFVKLLGQRT